MKHQAAFEAFTDAQDDAHVAEWRKMVEDFEADENMPNPYHLPKSGV